MLERDRVVAAVEIAHFTVAHIDCADRQARALRIQLIEIDQFGETVAQPR